MSDDELKAFGDDGLEEDEVASDSLSDSLLDEDDESEEDEGDLSLDELADEEDDEDDIEDILGDFNDIDNF